MIVVKGREMLIPQMERKIGTTYDNNAETRVFHIPRVSPGGVDLSNLDFHLDIEFYNQETDTVQLNKEVDEGELRLIWQIPDSMLQVPGTAMISIRGTDYYGTVKWASFRAAVYIEDTVNTPGSYAGKLTELEQFEEIIDDKMDELNALEQSMKNEETYRQEQEKLRQEQEQSRNKETAAVIATFDEENETAEYNAKLSESWAKGNTGVRAGEGMDNSKYYSEQSSAYADDAKAQADRAEMYAQFIEPGFIYQDNRILLNRNSTFEFALCDNHLMIKPI
jgi:hypothetical protein